MSDIKDDSATAMLLISADGKEPWEDITAPVESIEIEDDDTLTDQVKIVLDDSTSMLSHAAYEGLRLRAGLGYGAKTALIFEGVVTSNRIVTSPEGQKVELTALDYTFLMTKHTPNERVWKAGDSLSSAIKGIVESSKDPKRTPGPYPMVIQDILPPEDTKFSDDKPLKQLNVSDWEFLKQLADRNNSKVFVEFDGVELSKFYFVSYERLATAEPIGELDCCRWGGNLVTFTVEKIASGALKDVTASTVDFETGKTVTAKPEERAPGPELPPPAIDGRKDLTDSQKDALTHLVELAAEADKQIKAEKVQAAGATPDPDEAKKKVKVDPLRKLGYRASGVARGNTKLRAKSRVTISGVAPWVEGDWYLRKVSHKFTRTRVQQKYQSNYATTFEAMR
jgi:phage protein D